MENRPDWTDEQWYAEDLTSVAGVERLRFFPQVVASASGAILTTPEGREVIDLSASWTATGIGHAHPDVVAAAERALRAAPGGSVLSGTHPDAVLLARALCERVQVVAPVGERRAYLGHAGTDANDVALRAARHVTGRPGIVAFEGGYHGGLGASQSVSGIHISGGAPADPDLTLIPYPDLYRPWQGSADTLLADTLAQVEEALAGGRLAAVIVEPIQSDGGVLVPPEGFLAGLRDATSRHGTLLIVDEVKVGLGRTGHFLAHHAQGVVPDLVTLGKALGNGLPISALVGSAAALDEPAASALMTTIGNPVSCAAALAVLELLDDGALAAAAARLGETATDLLEAHAASDAPGAAWIGQVRGRGLSLGIELVVPGTQKPADDIAAKTAFAGWRGGVVAYPVRGNIIEITPPLTITPEQLRTGLDRLMAALDAAVEGAVSDADLAPFSGW
ncbi:aminotransferase class III-fold pyridoxal phosphate-dependent enzyme [Ornithinimicrobium faecis]|uniref:Aminotransferase class III-fold pyridoxal phosphate-dependent enzyme n=1 Tax=Ornithinimicrobium faecis TaxID=2934158 RepID=A0ABY4YQM1_9MICO|nr:aminotransferase class III-fold pyridoxal phosphate-dependent enzyme [Ornithinimicrobium sp. HY1793]USQ79076.1 aminotransferase class III-fold pyridoxal phosphate-dependent enzyme [Ornithinimicrobium sp. HY1793]